MLMRVFADLNQHSQSTPLKQGTKRGNDRKYVSGVLKSVPGGQHLYMQTRKGNSLIKPGVNALMCKRR